MLVDGHELNNGVLDGRSPMATLWDLNFDKVLAGVAPAVAVRTGGETRRAGRCRSMQTPAAHRAHRLGIHARQ